MSLICQNLPKRYLIAFLIFLGIINVYIMRVNLSVAIEDMKNDYQWTDEQKGLLLSSFFWGYFLLQIPSAKLAEKFGGKIMFGLSIFFTSIFTLLIPFCAKNFTLILILRAITGISEGLSFPTMYYIFSKWAAKTERSTFVSFCLSGQYIGIIIGYGFSGIIDSEHFRIFGVNIGGWEYIFYFFGTLGIIWYPIWLYIFQDNPINYDGISENELQLLYYDINTVKEVELSLMSSYNHQLNEQEESEEETEEFGLNGDEFINHINDRNDVNLYNNKNENNEKHNNIPWKEMLSNSSSRALFINAFAVNWVLYTLMTELPSYLEEQLSFDLESAGLISVLPYIMNWLTSFSSGPLADHLINSKKVSLKKVRILFQFLGLFMPAIFLSLCGFIYNRTLALIVMIIAISFSGFSTAGFSPNFLEICPKHSAVLFSISNTIATFSGIISPILTSYFILWYGELWGWRCVFFLASLLNIFAWFIFQKYMKVEPIEEINR